MPILIGKEGIKSLLDEKEKSKIKEKINYEMLVEKELNETKVKEFDTEFIADKIITFGEMFDNIKLYPYQIEIAKAIIIDILLNRGSVFTVEIARQAGKTESIAIVIKALSILLPKLAKLYKDKLGYFEKGFKVGIFAPEKTVSKTLFSRVADSLERDEAKPFLSDASISTELKSKNPIQLTNGSVIRNHSLLSKNLFSYTYDFIVIDEAQKIPNEEEVTENVYPMGSATNATIALVGVAGEGECLFSNTIASNRVSDERKHFEFDYKHVQEFNPRYKKYVAQRIKDVEEGRISRNAFDRGYNLVWGHEKSLFINKERLQGILDFNLNYVFYDKNPDSLIVAGIDLGKKIDSTVVTILKRVKIKEETKFQVLRWLQLDDMNYTEQRVKITEFLNNYHVSTILIDSTGIGEAFADEFESYYCNTGIYIDRFVYSDKSKAFGYMQLDAAIDAGFLIIPSSYSVQNSKEYKRFKKDCFASLWVQRKNFMLVESLKSKQRIEHDDYINSLMLAVLCMNNEIDNNSIESFEGLY